MATTNEVLYFDFVTFLGGVEVFCLSLVRVFEGRGREGCLRLERAPLLPQFYQGEMVKTNPASASG